MQQDMEQPLVRGEFFVKFETQLNCKLIFYYYFIIIIIIGGGGGVAGMQSDHCFAHFTWMEKLLTHRKKNLRSHIYDVRSLKKC